MLLKTKATWCGRRVTTEGIRRLREAGHEARPMVGEATCAPRLVMKSMSDNSLLGGQVLTWGRLMH